MTIQREYRSNTPINRNRMVSARVHRYLWHVSALSNYWSIRKKGLILNEEGRIYAHQFLIDPHRRWPLIWQAIYLPSDVALSHELSLLIVRIDSSKTQYTWMVDHRMNEYRSLNRSVGIHDNQSYFYTCQPIPSSALRIYRFEMEPSTPEMVSVSKNGVQHFMPNPDYKELKSLMGITLYLTPVKHE